MCALLRVHGATSRNKGPPPNNRCSGSYTARRGTGTNFSHAICSSLHVTPPVRAFTYMKVSISPGSAELTNLSSQCFERKHISSTTTPPLTLNSWVCTRSRKSRDVYSRVPIPADFALFTNAAYSTFCKVCTYLLVTHHFSSLSLNVNRFK